MSKTWHPCLRRTPKFFQNLQKFPKFEKIFQNLTKLKKLTSRVTSKFLARGGLPLKPFFTFCILNGKTWWFWEPTWSQDFRVRTKKVTKMVKITTFWAPKMRSFYVPHFLQKVRENLQNEAKKWTHFFDQKITFFTTFFKKSGKSGKPKNWSKNGQKVAKKPKILGVRGYGGDSKRFSALFFARKIALFGTF